MSADLAEYGVFAFLGADAGQITHSSAAMSVGRSAKRSHRTGASARSCRASAVPSPAEIFGGIPRAGRRRAGAAGLRALVPPRCQASGADGLPDDYRSLLEVVAAATAETGGPLTCAVVGKGRAST